MREPIRDKNRWEHIVKWIVPSLMSYEMTSSLFAGRWLFSLKPLIGTNGASKTHNNQFGQRGAGE